MYILDFFEIVGTLAFAISGALVGINKELDYFGVIVLAITTALGGGVVRDILIGITPPATFSAPSFTIMSIISAIIVFHFHKKLIKFENIIQFFDAIGLGAFTAIGANVAIDNNFHTPFLVILLALSTGTGGGIIRDVFAKEIPFVFRKEIYAVASIVGAICYLISFYFFTESVAMYFCFMVTFMIRIASMKLNLHLKVAKIENS